MVGHVCGSERWTKSDGAPRSERSLASAQTDEVCRVGWMRGKHVACRCETARARTAESGDDNVTKTHDTVPTFPTITDNTIPHSFG